MTLNEKLKNASLKKYAEYKITAKIIIEIEKNKREPTINNLILLTSFPDSFLMLN